MRLTLVRKVQTLSVAAMVFVALVGGAGLVASGALAGLVGEYTEHQVPSLRALADLSAATGSAATAASAVENGSLSPEAQTAAQARLAEQVKAVESSAKAFTALAAWGASDDGARRRLAASVGAWREEVEGFAAEARLRTAASDRFAEAAAIQSRVTDRYDKVRRGTVALLEALGAAAAGVEADADLLEKHAGALERRARGGMLGVSLLAAALIGVAGLGISRGVSRGIAGLREQARGLEAAVEAGRLATRADPAAVDAEFRPVIAGMNATMDAFQKPIAVTADCLTRISRGDIPPPVADAYQGDFNTIKDALNRCIEALRALLSDMEGMAGAQAAGDVDALVVPSRFEGAWSKLASGVNENVKLHLGVQQEILEVLRAYADGDFGKTLRRLPGKQSRANDVVDGVRENLKNVAGEVTALTRAAVEGRLSVRADASRFHGDWAALVRGVNDTLEAVVGPIRVAASYLERISAGDVPERITEEYRGDFAQVRNSLNRCIDALGRLVADAQGLAQAAQQGRLGVRADASRHQGDFGRIVEGVNRTLDATVAPVNEASEVLEQLAARDLRARVAGDYLADHARIKVAVNGTAAALHDALAQVASAVAQVSSAATQIAASSQAVASGASEQAASLQETTGSIDSVGSVTRQAADHAQAANALAQAAQAHAAEGTAAVEQMQAAMGKIRASAEGTSQIIKDVSDIAFQTNLLALNAAVEAARAGEAGRGFAVVAEEVRSLALRAKEAATKTEALIRESVAQAGEGEATGRRVGLKLGEITQGIGKVSAIVSEIAVAAHDQAAGIARVTHAVSEMDKVTQQNAASAEESSSAASELSGQAEELAAMVSEFRLDRSEVAPGPRPGAHAPKAARGAASRPGHKSHPADEISGF